MADVRAPGREGGREGAAPPARAASGAPGRAGAPSPRKAHALSLFAGLGDGYDRMGAVLSLGQEPRWRQALVARVPVGPGHRVLDVATGTGMVAAELVRAHGCSVVGLDQSEGMLATAGARLAADPALAARVELIRGEAERLPFPDATFDALTFTYLLRYVDDPGAVLAELARVVRPGGTIAALEFGVPDPPWRSLWIAYTRAALPIAGALASPDWARVGRFLGPSIMRFYEALPLPSQLALWRTAGIGGLRVLRLTRGAGVVISGTRDDGRA